MYTRNQHHLCSTVQKWHDNTQRRTPALTQLQGWWQSVLSLCQQVDGVHSSACSYTLHLALHAKHPLSTVPPVEHQKDEQMYA